LSDDPNPEGRAQVRLGLNASIAAKRSMRGRLARGLACPPTPVNCSDKEEAVTHGNFAWHELYPRDVEAAKAFHAATVGWTFEGMPMPHQNRTYWVAKAGDKPVAGFLDMRGIVPDTDPPHWLSYLEVDDVDRLVAEVQSHGGRIVRPPFDVPEFGRIAIGADGTGAFMAWVTLKR
jgi:predicted enzyme related to lactoylglutathione lyase